MVTNKRLIFHYEGGIFKCAICSFRENIVGDLKTLYKLTVFKGFTPNKSMN